MPIQLTLLLTSLYTKSLEDFFVSPVCRCVSRWRQDLALQRYKIQHKKKDEILYTRPADSFTSYLTLTLVFFVFPSWEGLQPALKVETFGFQIITACFLVCFLHVGAAL
jgi:hypothetical protein